MTGAEMHALEKAALDDPFLAEALEGFGDHAATIPGDLRELEERLRERAEEKDKSAPEIPLKRHWWRVAAIVLLLAGSAVLTYRLIWKPAGQPIADTNKKAGDRPVSPETEDTGKSTGSFEEGRGNAAVNATGGKEAPGATGGNAASNTTNGNTVPDATNGNASANVTNGKVVPDATIGDVPPDAIIGNASSNTTSKNALAEATRPSKKLEHTEIKGRAHLEEKKRVEEADMAALAKKETASLNTARIKELAGLHARGERMSYFRGQVTDTAKNPIPGAVVLLEKEKTSFRTDSIGRFLIPAQDSLAVATVNVIGYTPGKVTLNARKEENSIRLQEHSSALDEVVVVGYSAKKKQVTVGASTQRVDVKPLDAKPVTGWPAFRKYLSDSSRIPRDPGGLTKLVIVHFEVKPSGKMTRFRVERSPGKAYEEEALRLIKAGPKWETTGRKKAEIRVSVTF